MFNLRGLTKYQALITIQCLPSVIMNPIAKEFNLLLRNILWSLKLFRAYFLKIIAHTSHLEMSTLFLGQGKGRIPSLLLSGECPAI